MGSFITGALSGYAGMAGKMKEKGSKGLLRRGNKRRPLTGRVRQYDSATGKVGEPKSVDSQQSTSGGDYVPSLGKYIPGAKRGMKVKKNRIIRVHKGERVLTKKQAEKYRGGKRR